MAEARTGTHVLASPMHSMEERAMNVVITGAVAGVLGTLAMDLLNLIAAQTGIILKIDAAMIGRMAVGWLHGRFRYGHPSEMAQADNEKVYGYVTHYGIGVALAAPFVLGWALFVGGPASPIWALAYGIATTAASWFFVYPCMGFGAFGRRSPEGIRAVLAPLANHFFYGVGLAVGVVLMAAI